LSLVQLHERFKVLTDEIKPLLMSDGAAEIIEYLDIRRDAVFVAMFKLPIASLREAAILAMCAKEIGAIGSWWDKPTRELDWPERVARQLVDKIVLEGCRSQQPV
jgi:hypothetical protein